MAAPALTFTRDEAQATATASPSTEEAQVSTLGHSPPSTLPTPRPTAISPTGMALRHLPTPPSTRAARPNPCACSQLSPKRPTARIEPSPSPRASGPTCTRKTPRPVDVPSPARVPREAPLSRAERPSSIQRSCPESPRRSKLASSSTNESRMVSSTPTRSTDATRWTRLRTSSKRRIATSLSYSGERSTPKSSSTTSLTTIDSGIHRSSCINLGNAWLLPSSLRTTSARQSTATTPLSLQHDLIP